MKLYKSYFILLLLAFGAMKLNAQTGIGTTTPNASAKLDVFSTNKGFLPPRVALTGVYDATTITTPATGLLVYCTGTGGLSSGYYFWNGTAWATIATEGGSGSVAAEFGSQMSPTASIAITSTTPADVLSFTLPTAGTWEVISFVRSQGAAGYAAEFALYDPSGNVVPNSEILPAYGQAASTGTGVIRITTTGVATYKLKAWATTAPTSNYAVVSDGNGRTGVTWQKISGNAPVTGQSVDYGIVRYTGADGSSLAAGALVGFDASAAGNLVWTANKFTLKANRTYVIESSLAIYNISAGSAGRFQIYDYTNGVSLANSLFMSQNGTGSYSQNANTPMKCIVTPTSDMQVGIRLLDFYGGAPSIIGNAVLTGSSSASNASYFMVAQIGSSAIVNPWVLNSTDVYNTIGKVGIGTNAPAQTLDVTGTAKITTTPSITTATNVLVKDPTTSQISEQPISFITGVAKFIRNANQGSITAGTTVLLNTSSNNTISNYVALNTSTGVITLQPGTYELNGSVGALGGSSGFNGDCRIYPVFHNGSAYVGTGGVSETGPAGNWNGMPQNNANYIITVAVGQTAQLTLKAAIVNNVATLSETGDYGAIGDAGRAWVVVRKYN